MPLPLRWIASARLAPGAPLASSLPSGSSAGATSVGERSNGTPTPMTSRSHGKISR